MDVALKQRLVGALVLVALGVIFIPMVLDGPGSQRIERPIAIPEAPDRRFETRLLPVNQPTAQDAATPDSQAQDSTPEPISPAPAPGQSVAVVTPAPAQRPPSPQPTSPEVVVPQPQAAPPTQPDADFVLQVGSFGNAANAARLVQNLQQGGWSAYQEKVAVGADALYRVRVSGWKNKQDASLAGERLLQAFPDLDMSVRQVRSTELATEPLKGWMIQLGSFNSEPNALALRDRLRAGGFSAHTLDTGSRDGGRWRVRVGPELDRSTALETRDQIRSQFDLRGIILDHP